MWVLTVLVVRKSPLAISLLDRRDQGEHLQLPLAQGIG
jgi:hypothetical protein